VLRRPVEPSQYTSAAFNGCTSRLQCVSRWDEPVSVGTTLKPKRSSRHSRSNASTSGDKRRQGSITKVGNSHVRRLLVESAWHARRRPKVGHDLARRHRGQDALVIERS
jgi:hypothetical protein